MCWAFLRLLPIPGCTDFFTAVLRICCYSSESQTPTGIFALLPQWPQTANQPGIVLTSHGPSFARATAFCIASPVVG